jgi:hypothetical protein
MPEAVDRHKAAPAMSMATIASVASRDGDPVAVPRLRSWLPMGAIHPIDARSATKAAKWRDP